MAGEVPPRSVGEDVGGPGFLLVLDPDLPKEG